MARYWVFFNEAVSGPFEVDSLIRMRGFSRQTLVCMDDGSGNPKSWTSPAEIPELAHIFKAVEERLADMSAPAKAKAPPKARPPRVGRPFIPAVILKTPSRSVASILGWIMLVSLLLGGGYFNWSIRTRHSLQALEMESARMLIESVHLPAPSPYGSLPQYFQDKNIKPRWAFEKIQDALYHVTLSWYAPAASGGQVLSVYAFEVNTQVQTVRGLNSAASTLLSAGFPAPKSKVAEVPKKKAADLFPQALEASREALENGDFQAVWNLYSNRKKAEMAKAGISRDGFLRLQGLTHQVEAAKTHAVLKTKENSETENLVLIKESQEGHPDIFVKQIWIFEDGAWKLDDEQKKSSSVNSPSPESKPTPVAPAVPEPAVTPTKLPGMSN